MNVEAQETEESVVECAQCRIGAPFRREYLEQPDGDVNCQAQWTAMSGEVSGAQFCDTDPLARSEFFEQAGDAHPPQYQVYWHPRGFIVEFVVVDSQDIRYMYRA